MKNLIAVVVVAIILAGVFSWYDAGFQCIIVAKKVQPAHQEFHGDIIEDVPEQHDLWVRTKHGDLVVIADVTDEEWKDYREGMIVYITEKARIRRR